MKTASSAVVLSIALGTVGMAAPGALGSITGTTGAATQISPPLACGPGQLTGFTASAWNEQVNVPVSTGIFVDMVNNPGTSSGAIPGVISGAFDSHFIHFEPIPGAVGAVGTVTFSGPIVGVIFVNSTLDNTDAVFGAGGTAYPTFYPQRGLSAFPASTFSINGNTLAFNFQATIPTAFVDQVRVLTHVPGPGAWAVMGLAGVVGLRRRRKE